jgi:glycosyltransferase involved in cell wall biosynthesis
MTAMVAVILPIYEENAFRIKRAVDSVFRQQYRDWHLYMVYDGGADRRLSSKNLYKPKDGPVTVMKIERCGVGDARHRGIQQGNEPIIAYVDADDLWFPDHLQRGTTAILADLHPFVFFKGQAFGDWRNPELRREEVVHPLDPELGVLPEPPYWVPENLFKHNIMVTCGAMHTRPLYNLSSGWRTSPWFSDWDLWKRIGEIEMPVCMKEFTSQYEIRQGSLSTRRKRKENYQ